MKTQRPKEYCPTLGLDLMKNEQPCRNMIGQKGCDLMNRETEWETQIYLFSFFLACVTVLPPRYGAGPSLWNKGLRLSIRQVRSDNFFIASSYTEWNISRSYGWLCEDGF
jgi:hypothetical protein